MVFCADEVGDAVEELLRVLVIAFCEDDIDKRAEVEKKVEEGDVVVVAEAVVVEDERNGITMAGFEATDGLDMEVDAATIEVAITGADVDA